MFACWDVMIVSLVSLLIILASGQAIDVAGECDLWLAPSKIDGKGIFAGRAYAAGEDLDFGVSIPVPFQKIVGTMLANYVHVGPTEYFMEEELEYSMVHLGITMIMNHHAPPARTSHFHEEEEEDAEGGGTFVNETLTSPYATMAAVWHGTEIDLAPGDEIFNIYSEDNTWFADKGLIDLTNKTDAESTPPLTPLTLEEIENSGHCMTQVYVNTSSIVRAGLGLFAARDFDVGEVVSVSPVLILPRLDIEEMQITSILQNFCIAGDETEVVILPISASMMANHALEPNLKMQWHLWNAEDQSQLDAILAQNVSTLVESKFTKLDLAFLATQKIRAGDELSVNYGRAWANAWAQYLAEYAAWLTHHHHGSQQPAPEVPIFRHFISAPPGLMPDHWNWVYEENTHLFFIPKK